MDEMISPDLRGSILCRWEDHIHTGTPRAVKVTYTIREEILEGPYDNSSSLETLVAGAT